MPMVEVFHERSDDAAGLGRSDMTQHPFARQSVGNRGVFHSGVRVGNHPASPRMGLESLRIVDVSPLCGRSFRIGRLTEAGRPRNLSPNQASTRLGGAHPMALALER